MQETTYIAREMRARREAALRQRKQERRQTRKTLLQRIAKYPVIELTVLSAGALWLAAILYAAGWCVEKLDLNRLADLETFFVLCASAVVFAFPGFRLIALSLVEIRRRKYYGRRSSSR